MPGTSPEYTLTGFTRVDGTEFVSGSTTITLPAGSDLANKVSNAVSEADLIEYILAHQDQFFVNPPAGLTAADITIESRVDSDGSISFQIALSKYISSDTGTVETGGKLPGSPTFTINGFHVDTAPEPQPQPEPEPGPGPTPPAPLQTQSNQLQELVMILQTTYQELAHLKDLTLLLKM